MVKALGDGNVIDIGDLETDPRDAQLETLRAENRRLQRALSDAELRADRAREDADRALSNLRRQLGPLYRALQMVFGELDAAGVADSPSTATSASPAPAVDQRATAVWESWKQKLPGAPAKVIDALLLHAEMNYTQLAIAIGVHRNSIPNIIWKLKRAGLITKNGNRVSLNQLS